MTLLGEAGLRRLARINHANAVKLADALAGVPGVEVLNETFFNEFTAAAAKARRRGRRGAGRKGHPRRRAGLAAVAGAGLDDLLLVAATEVNTDDDRAALAAGAEGGAVMLNRQGRPTTPGEAGTGEHHDLHRQQGAGADRAADLRDRRRRDDRRRSSTSRRPSPTASAASAPQGRSACPGLSEPEAMRHYVRLVAEELRHRHRASSRSAPAR